MIEPHCIEHVQAPDGYLLATRVWRPAKPRARVVLLHGIISHGGWYVRCGSELVRQGFEVHLPDRRGSGLNWHGRGDVPRCQTWLDDMAAYLAALPNDLPRLLVGISWGGKFAAEFARRHPELLAGVGLICPGIYAFQQADVLRRTALRLMHASAASRLRVPIPLNDPALFTDSPEYQLYIHTDPLTLRKITVRFAVADLELNALARQEERRLTLPALLMLAGRDRIVDNQRTRQFFRAVTAGPQTLIEYADFAHTFEFEPGRTQYFADLGDWLRAQA